MAVGGVGGELVSVGGSLLRRENAGNFFDFGPLERIRAEIPVRFRGRNVKFPVIGNRESFSVNREIKADETGL
jgi:hypothetical protein